MPAPKGNSNATKGKLWRDALERALARNVTGKSKTVEKGLDPIADTVVKNALNGDKDSWVEIANRLDGKPATSVTVSGDEDAPLFPDKVVIELVRPKNGDS